MHHIRPLKSALNASGRFAYKPPEGVVDFIVVGGGVVGLAIAQRLSSKFPGRSTILVERHPSAGEETSSRNSEVIHSGLYYPPESLKTRLCLRGRDLLYERCKAQTIPYRQTGKLVVASGPEQQVYIESLHSKSLQLKWIPQSRIFDQAAAPHTLQTQLMTGNEARNMEPNLSQSITGALWCPQTGIVDSHIFMESLEKDITNSGGDLAYATRVVRLDRHRPVPQAGSSRSDQGWVVQTVTKGESEPIAVLTRVLINASGLSGTFLLNSVLPESDWMPIYFARGSYASYHGAGAQGITHLIYPCPRVGSDAHAFQSLGTHLTLDLQGKIRFGPDIEWISAPEPSSKIEDEDALFSFWTKHLIPDESRLKEMHDAVTDYLPGVKRDGLQPDYVGIRPKLVPPTGKFQDFVLRTDYSDPWSKAGLMVSLLGIESPGLTSSLAIAEMTVDELIAPRCPWISQDEMESS